MKTFIHKYNSRSPILLIRLLLLVLLGALLSSCERALEPEFPDFLLSEEALFENAATVDAALANIYAGLRDNSPVSGGVDGMGVLLGLYADELDYYRENAPIDNAFYNHTVLPNTTAVGNFWNSSYSLIFSANKIVEGLEDAPLEEEERNVFMGEALFLRAYLHFYLAQLFGDIPYITTTDYSENSRVSRMPLTEIYQMMETDLLTAKNLLPAMEHSGERLRVSKGVATAMLARMYLYSQQWEKAVTESTAVITDGTYTLQQQFCWPLLPQHGAVGQNKHEKKYGELANWKFI